MERRSQHAHGTRSAPIHGIAEDAIAPEASSTESDTLSTKLASERIPIPIESKRTHVRAGSKPGSSRKAALIVRIEV